MKRRTLPREQRYYISFSCKDSWNRVTRKHEIYAWPILFPTKEAAWAYGFDMNCFRHKEAMPGRGKIISWSVSIARNWRPK